MKGLHILDLENEILILSKKIKKKKKKNKTSCELPINVHFHDCIYFFHYCSQSIRARGSTIPPTIAYSKVIENHEILKGFNGKAN